MKILHSRFIKYIQMAYPKLDWSEKRQNIHHQPLHEHLVFPFLWVFENIHSIVFSTQFDTGNMLFLHNHSVNNYRERTHGMRALKLEEWKGSSSRLRETVLRLAYETLTSTSHSLAEDKKRTSIMPARDFLPPHTLRFWTYSRQCFCMYYGTWKDATPQWSFRECSQKYVGWHHALKHRGNGKVAATYCEE